MLLGAVMAVAPATAGAGSGMSSDGTHKVTICHRTNSVTNPYVTPTVDFDAANGTITEGPNHYEHSGPVFKFGATDAPEYDDTYPTPRNGPQWGDIIPPVPLFTDGEPVLDNDGAQVYSTGQNWTAEGQAIWAAGCQAPGTAPGSSESPVVIVEKDVPDVQAAEPFSFSINGGTPFTVADGGASGDHVVPAGPVSVSEDLGPTPGYALTGVVCTRVSADVPAGSPVPVTPAGGGVNFPIANGEIVTCKFTNERQLTVTPQVTIAKTNDGNLDGTYGESEPTVPDATVPFRLVIQNTGNVPLTVASLIDSWGQQTLDLLDPRAGLTCTTGGASPFPMGKDAVLPVGVPITCAFSVPNYVVALGASVTNTATLDTVETAPVQDTSTVTTPPPVFTPPPVVVDNASYSLVVDKLNNADGSGGFRDAETAPRAGADVEFQLTIRNMGTSDLTLTSLEDVFTGQTVDLLGVSSNLDCGTTELQVSSILAAGSTTVCTFVLDDYAPAAGESISNTVTIVTDQVQDRDTSTVRVAEVQGVEVLPSPGVTPAGPPPVAPSVNPAVATPTVTPLEVSPLEVTPLAVAPNQQARQMPAAQVKGDVVTRQLARTGSESSNLAGFGAGLLLLGIGMVITSRARLRPVD